jgi:hypothetical protein
MLLTLFLGVLFAGAIYWVHGNIEYGCALLRRRILFAPPPEPIVQGFVPGSRLIALRWAVARRAFWPPERNRHRGRYASTQAAFEFRGEFYPRSDSPLAAEVIFRPRSHRSSPLVFGLDRYGVELF